MYSNSTGSHFVSAGGQRISNIDTTITPPYKIWILARVFAVVMINLNKTRANTYIENIYIKNISWNRILFTCSARSVTKYSSIDCILRRHRHPQSCHDIDQKCFTKCKKGEKYVVKFLDLPMVQMVCLLDSLMIKF